MNNKTKINAVILQEFKGNVNGVEFYNQQIYLSVKYILERIVDKFGLCFNKNFIISLAETIEYLFLKTEDFSFDTLEKEFSNIIEYTDLFKRLNFKYNESTWLIEKLNSRIQNGELSL